MPLELASLWLYPVKSCAGLQVPSAELMHTGLRFDREWMVVDAQGEFLSQRELPRLALIQPKLGHSELVLRAPGMIALHLQLDGAESETTVRLWDDHSTAFDMGPLAGQWVSDFLGQPGLRLAAFDSEHPRSVRPQASGGRLATQAFTDEAPLLVLSQATLDHFNADRAAAGLAPIDARRFRPNLVVAGDLPPRAEDGWSVLHLDTPDGEVSLALTQPCHRCPVPDVNPDTGEVDQAVMPWLQGQTTDRGVTVGMHAVVLSGHGRRLHRGAAVRVESR